MTYIYTVTYNYFRYTKENNLGPLIVLVSFFVMCITVFSSCASIESLAQAGEYGKAEKKISKMAKEKQVESYKILAEIAFNNDYNSLKYYKKAGLKKSEYASIIQNITNNKRQWQDIVKYKELLLGLALLSGKTTSVYHQYVLSVLSELKETLIEQIKSGDKKELQYTVRAFVNGCIAGYSAQIRNDGDTVKCCG